MHDYDFEVDEETPSHLFDVGVTKPIVVPELPPDPPKVEIPDPTQPMIFEPPVAGATISDDGLYRYSLFRKFQASGKKILFVGVNPSTADSVTDDATVRRLVSFAKRDGFAELWLCNASPFRSTDPKKLKTLALKDHNYEKNQEEVYFTAAKADIVVACWGNNVELLPYAQQFAEWLEGAFPVFCFGLTKRGHPKHPLRLAANTPLVPYVYSPTKTVPDAPRDEEDF